MLSHTSSAKELLDLQNILIATKHHVK